MSDGWDLRPAELMATGHAKESGGWGCGCGDRINRYIKHIYI